MSLDLSREEMALICDALDTRRQQLHSELVHTDDRALREDLKAMLAKLESLEGRLGRPRQA